MTNISIMSGPIGNNVVYIYIVNYFNMLTNLFKYIYFNILQEIIRLIVYSMRVVVSCVLYKIYNSKYYYSIGIL